MPPVLHRQAEAGRLRRPGRAVQPSVRSASAAQLVLTAPRQASGDDGERHRRLLGVKLRALVGDHLGLPVDAEPEPHPAGSALVVGTDAWVLVERTPERALGGALAWALRRGAQALHVVAEASTGLLARRAERLAFPISVWFAEGRTLLPAVVEPLREPPPPAAAHLALASLIERSGATVNVEHAVVFGEVRGLEVCRVVDEPTTGHVAELGDVLTSPAGLGAEPPTRPSGPPTDPGVILEVGVGANDREAFRLLHGDVPTAEALAGVVDLVLTHRSLDAPQHPLNRLARERFLRWRIERTPALAGLTELTPAEPPIRRPNLRDPVPCVGRGRDLRGRPVTVVCSAGVDLDLVPYVCDVQLAHDDPVIVALPARDRVAITDELAALVTGPVDIVAVS